jgi:HTH-type transcriptional regulator/antitoxin MqsA
MKNSAEISYPNSIACYLCGSDSPLAREMRPVQIGTRKATVEDVFYRCSQCGEEVYLGWMADATSRKAAAVIRAEDGLLAPDDIVALRRRYGVSQAQLERLIGAGEKTVVRWERGTVAQNRTADTLLRVLGEHPDIVAQLARERNVRLRPRGAAPAARKRPRRTATRPARADAGD